MKEFDDFNAAVSNLGSAKSSLESSAVAAHAAIDKAVAEAKAQVNSPPTN